MVITGKNIMHSAFYLAATLLCVAVYFILLRAEYLAAVQILVYIGSVIVLIIFALMLTRTKVGEDTNITNNQKIFASLIAMILFVCLTIVFSYSKIETVAENASELKVISINDFASVLFTKYALPFEVASVLLLAALVGSIVLAMKEKKSNGQDSQEFMEDDDIEENGKGSGSEGDELNTGSSDARTAGSGNGTAGENNGNKDL
jgi:NADH-quinone oxidoreductase subunit J